MQLGCPDSEWVLRMGPITRTNHAGSRAQAEEGALRRIQDAVRELVEKARPLEPLLREGAVCAGPCTPELREDPAEPQVFSYPLSDGKWFSVAGSGVFGFKLTCRRPG